MSGSTRFAHRAAGWVVRLAALWAPAGRRDRMRREWDAELQRELAEGGGWSALLASLGAIPDAATLRRLERQREGRMTTMERVTRWARDMGIAIRGLSRAPGFTAVAVATLAIGLGGSAAIYTLLDRVVLDPLPYPEAERLVRLENQVPGVGPDEVWAVSTAQYVYFTDQVESLEAVGLYRAGGGNIMTPNGPERARLAMVTASMMGLLGAEAHLGRLIEERDDDPGATITVLLSHGLWTRALGADPDIVGRTIDFNDLPIEVIGVLEPGIELPGWTPSMAPDIWMPMRVNRTSGFSNSHVFPAIARLAEGATPAEVEAEVERLTPRLPETFPDVYSERFFEQYGFRTVVTPLKESVVGDLARSLWLLFGGIGLVLLIACANVMNLFLVRVEAKRREIAIRTALGADRGAIGRYLTSEALALALAGGVLALAVGFWAVPALTALAPEDLPRVQGVAMGPGTVLFTAGLALAVGLLVAAFPLLAHRRTPGPLGDGGRTATAGRERHRARSVLVVSQMALAVTLLVGAGLLVQSLGVLQRTDTGMEPERAFAVDLYMNPHTHDTDVLLWETYSEMLRRIEEVPGVVTAGLGEEVPVAGGFGCTVQGFENEAIYERVRAAGLTTCAGQTRVTPGYFEALGIPVLEGRALDLGDHTDPSRASVVVSRAFAERFWPGEPAIGQGVAPGGRTVPPYYRVVGVVGDVARRADEGQPPLSQDAMAIYYPVVYDPQAPQWGGWWAGNVTLVVRTGVDDPLSLYPAVRRVIADVGPEIPLANARSLEELVDEATADVTFVSLLLAIAAAVALALAAVGLYGVIAYIVSRRTREIGMRLAIGAEPGSVVRTVVAGTLKLVALGLAVGIPLALGVSRVGRGLLVGVEPTAPIAYAGASALLVAVALLASWLPARRAARVDPVTALRAE